MTSIEYNEDDEITRVTYRIQLNLQTPAPELLSSDLNLGYEYDRVYRYVVYAARADQPAVVNTRMKVPLLWRRAATYVEVDYRRSWLNADNVDDVSAAASFFVHRQSMINDDTNNWNEHDPLSHAGVHGGTSAPFTSLCFASSE